MRFYFNWRTVTLHYCDGLCHGSAWIGHRCTLSPSHLPPHPTPLGCPSTSFGCPASCMGLALAVSFIYGNIHVSALFSQIIPPSPSPTESKSLFFTSVSRCRTVLNVGTCQQGRWDGWGGQEWGRWAGKETVAERTGRAHSASEPD